MNRKSAIEKKRRGSQDRESLNQPASRRVKKNPGLLSAGIWEEEGPHEEVALFTSLYAGDEEAGSKTEKDPPEALPEAPGAILPALPPGASLYSLCQR